jgi:hypothetical protein
LAYLSIDFFLVAKTNSQEFIITIRKRIALTGITAICFSPITYAYVPYKRNHNVRKHPSNKKIPTMYLIVVFLTYLNGTNSIRPNSNGNIDTEILLTNDGISSEYGLIPKISNDIDIIRNIPSNIPDVLIIFPNEWLILILMSNLGHQTS